jgi:hypothetical protein
LIVCNFFDVEAFISEILDIDEKSWRREEGEVIIVI